MIAKSYARIHRQNLCNFGILPLWFVDPQDHGGIEQDDVLEIPDTHKALKSDEPFTVNNKTKNTSFKVEHKLSEREKEWIMAGSLINVILERHKG